MTLRIFTHTLVSTRIRGNCSSERFLLTALLINLTGWFPFFRLGVSAAVHNLTNWRLGCTGYWCSNHRDYLLRLCSSCLTTKVSDKTTLTHWNDITCAAIVPHQNCGVMQRFWVDFNWTASDGIWYSLCLYGVCGFVIGQEQLSFLTIAI